MAESNLNFDKDVAPVARHWAKVTFARDSDRSAKTADVVSEAWVLYRTAGPDATADSLAWYAVRRVAIGRQFSQSARSLTEFNPRRVVKATRMKLATDIVGSGDDPAELAALRIDFPEWFNTQLNERKQEICEAVLQGDSTAELAERFGVTPGAISQVRRWLVENWLAYTA